MLPIGRKIIMALVCPLLLSWNTWAAADVVLVSDVKVTGVFSDFNDLFDSAEPYYALYFQLEPSNNTTDLCPLGAHINADNLWKVAGPSNGDVNKAFTLLNMAWLTGMTISIEGSATAPVPPESRCSNETINNIILHKP